MSRPPVKKYSATNHTGDARSAPYPVSRMAPATELMDLAKIVAEADKSIQSHATGKLKVIANQIKSLQDEARRILEQAQRDQTLHRARCHSQRIPGKTYYLYQHDNDELYFSLLSPEDWGGQPPHAYAGAYRLEMDMSWTALDESDAEESDMQPILQQLLHTQED